MSQNVERPIMDNSDIGLEVVDGLEHTLAWIKTQFDEFRYDVGDERPLSKAASASFHN